MEINYFTNKSDDNVINKELTLNSTGTINLKSTTDITSPQIMVSRRTVGDSNYIKIPQLKRAYFISDLTEFNNDYVQLQLDCDLLETYKDIILDSPATITATEHPSYFASGLPVATTTEIDKYNSDTTLPATRALVMLTIGG